MEPMKPMKPMEPMKAQKPWWPADLGSPSSSGSQNDARYAYFAESNRLVVDLDGNVKTYDTGGKRIDGFGQQSGKGGPSFSADGGDVSLDDLQVVG